MTASQHKYRKRGTGSFSHGYRRIAQKLEHVIVAERALGKPLPAGAEVHHVDEIKANNAPSNLVICQDHRYHALLHVRTRALAACGDASFRCCLHCHRWDAPAAMKSRRGGASFWHTKCDSAYQRAARARRAIKTLEESSLV